jgi:dihydroorotate dehydrogenase
MTTAMMKASGNFYRKVVKPVCFRFDPERVHNAFITTGSILGSNPLTRGIASMALDYENPILEQRLMGINFRNPVGLSAGFDKDGKAAMIMRSVGFGFADVGSVTAMPCRGNSGKRLTRFPDRKSILVNLGLNNRGAMAVHESLMNKDTGIPMIVSAAKTNSIETIEPHIGMADYLFTIDTFKDIADVFELNISCPNAFGGEDFAKPDLFDILTLEISKLKLRQPVIVKMSPDLTRKNIDRIVEIAAKHDISGFVLSNLNKKHDLGKGGLSGKAVEGKANDLLSYVYRKNLSHKKRFTLIGAGGIFSADDAYTKIKLGANLVQLITGMIYNGPQLIGEINCGLAELLERDEYKNIGEAVGGGD